MYLSLNVSSLARIEELRAVVRSEHALGRLTDEEKGIGLGNLAEAEAVLKLRLERALGARFLLGQQVFYTVAPEIQGKLAYVTSDGWAGIRQAGDRLDEVPASEIVPVRR